MEDGGGAQRLDRHRTEPKVLSEQPGRLPLPHRHILPPTTNIHLLEQRVTCDSENTTGAIYPPPSFSTLPPAFFLLPIQTSTLVLVYNMRKEKSSSLSYLINAIFSSDHMKHHTRTGLLGRVTNPNRILKQIIDRYR